MTASLWGRNYYYSHFIDGEIKGKKVWVTCSRAHSHLGSGLKLSTQVGPSWCITQFIETEFSMETVQCSPSSQALYLTVFLPPDNDRSPPPSLLSPHRSRATYRSNMLLFRPTSNCFSTSTLTYEKTPENLFWALCPFSEHTSLFADSW